MRAVTIRDGGRIEVADHHDPVPGKGELLVRVEAAGLNWADTAQRAGFYPAPPGSPADIPGLELAGVVEVVGDGVLRFGPGDRVMSLVGGGGQAELALVHEREALAIPENVAPLEAGGFPEAFTTAHDALFTQCGLGPGERLLVNGAAGGVGIAAVQLGAAAGADVIASVRRAELRDAVAAFGATAVAPEDVERHGPFDVVLELVGAPNFASDVAYLDTCGRIVVIGVAAGSRVEIDLHELMAKRARVFASTLRARPLEAKAAAARLVERHVLPLLAAGRLRVPIEARYPLEEVETAYARFGEGGKLGKIVLAMSAST
jgi:NADPH:quinone reductase